MNETAKNRAVYAIITLLILGSVWMVLKFGVNVPHWDDHAIRVLIDEFSWSKIGGLFKFHNEHRIWLTRTVTLIYESISGDTNFKFMMYFGQFGLVALMLLYILLARHFKLNSLSLLFLALFIFNFSTVENSLWGMAAIQNHCILFFAIGSLCFLSTSYFNEKTSFIAAIIFSILALLTSGNAVLIAPIGLAILFFLGRKKQMLIWLGVHTLVFAIYFIGFEKSVSERPHIEDFFLNFLALNGSHFYPILDTIFNTKLAYIFGLLNILFGLWVIFRLFFSKDTNEKTLNFLAIQAFFLGTLALVAIGRNDYQVETLLSSKYKIYSFLIFGTNILFGWQFYKSQKWKYALAAIAVFLFLNAQVSYLGLLRSTHMERVAYTINLKHEQRHLKKTAYHLPTFNFEKSLSIDMAEIDPSKIDSIAFEGNHLLFFENNLQKFHDNYIWLKSKDSEYLLPLRLVKGSLFGTVEGIAYLERRNFKTDVYQTYLLEVSDNKAELFDAVKTLKIEGIPYTEAPKNW
ncbi:hypothetical protein [Arcticibacterium luteifluviistationis]|uniref:Glycosyltransferase RgtA/B/C/D-like domain-containing protein n=1 Tax=Arcticibacterium luteifluviistationis TaxID=1784714 RepID=A0A2Z4GAL0_9BACT|nr:hypothetical protein [Arcticibacterium luteifluviistationis]AWV98237.1 hypothetical protein DJ013_08660 [Arcticibacterium luteifluviistationis]